MGTSRQFERDPDSVKDYTEDWSDWLPSGDTISDSTWTVVSGDVTIDSDSNTTTTTTVWLSGGTLGTWAKVTNHITTAAGREEDCTLTFFMTDN